MGRALNWDFVERFGTVGLAEFSAGMSFTALDVDARVAEGAPYV
jgi:hypothetical protein